MDAKPVGKLPWQPQCEILGNLAIGNIRENMLRFLRTDRGVHAETLHTAMGALAGFAAQNAALNRAAAVASTGESMPWSGIVLIGADSGERFLAGDWINAGLFNERGSIFPLWGFIAAAATEAGAKTDALADIGEIARHVTSSFGNPEFGKLRAPPNHQPGVQPVDLLLKLWPRACEILRLPIEKQIPTAGSAMMREPPLSERHWPIIISIVAGQFIKLTKDVLAPDIAFALAMESAVIGSKIDPDRLEPGKWDIRASDGRLTVGRRGD